MCKHSILITKSRNCTRPKLVIEKRVRSTSFSITSRTRTIATTVILKLMLRTAFKITDPLRPKSRFSAIIIYHTCYCTNISHTNNFVRSKARWHFISKIQTHSHLFECITSWSGHKLQLRQNFVAQSKMFWLANLFILKLSINHNLHIYPRNKLRSVSRTIYNVFNISDLKIISFNFCT